MFWRTLRRPEMTLCGFTERSLKPNCAAYLPDLWMQRFMYFRSPKLSFYFRLTVQNMKIVSTLLILLVLYLIPQWGAADAEIKVPSVENIELKRSPSKAWSRSVYSHKCYAYCQGFLPSLFLPLRSFHLHFFPKTSPSFFPALAVINSGSCVGPQSKIGHPAGCRFPC